MKRALASVQMLPSDKRAKPATSRDVPASKQKRGECGEPGDEGGDHDECLHAVHERAAEDPGPLDSMSSVEAPSAVAIEYPFARRNTFVSGSRTLTLSANALRSPSMTSA